MIPRFPSSLVVAIVACGGGGTRRSDPRNVGGETCEPAPDARYVQGNPLGVVERGTAPDLDGDGRPEQWVTAQGSCGGSGTCIYTIVDGAACRVVGIAGASGFTPTVERPGVFVTVERDMHAVREARYAWNGRAYVAVAVRLCLTQEDPACRECRPWQPLAGTPYPTGDVTRAGWPALSASLGPATRCDPPE